MIPNVPFSSSQSMRKRTSGVKLAKKERQPMTPQVDIPLQNCLARWISLPALCRQDVDCYVKSLVSITLILFPLCTINSLVKNSCIYASATSCRAFVAMIPILSTLVFPPRAGVLCHSAFISCTISLHNLRNAFLGMINSMLPCRSRTCLMIGPGYGLSISCSNKVEVGFSSGVLTALIRLSFFLCWSPHGCRFRGHNCLDVLGSLFCSCHAVICGETWNDEMGAVGGPGAI